MFGDEGDALVSFPRFVGMELGLENWLTIVKERIDAFATATGLKADMR